MKLMIFLFLIDLIIWKNSSIFNPIQRSKTFRNIKYINNYTNNVLRNRQVKTNQMTDLNLVAKSTSQVKENIHHRDMVTNISTSKRKHDYLLYFTNSITMLSILLIIG